MSLLISIGLFIPLVSFLLLLFTSDIIGRKPAGIIACVSIFISFICFSTLLGWYIVAQMNPITVTLFNWIPVDQINASFSLHLDPLSFVMTLIITGVGFLIHVYALGYMEHEEDFARFFACLNFFIFAMLLLVLASNLLLLFVGWEGVGLASYLLIGFWYHRPAAAKAATKAFVINRIGDCGFLIALLLTFYLFGTSDIETISTQASASFSLGAPIITVVTLLFFLGATGKSAQIPLHTWLADAMEGPTPVSALIHAATMVTAGVYLIVRMHELFMLAPITMHLIAFIGAVTSLFAALSALGQTDLKRVLAYSTVSQLGLMFLACGVGAFYAAMFHLMNHAFVKALLFLSAGNVVHMLNGATNMEKMGGLAKIFTKTHWLFLIGALALSGIPPLSAFFSKDLILEQDYLAGFDTLFYVALTASILTAIYLTRAYILTFLGSPRLEEKILKVAKEAPAIMLTPTMILAVLSLLGGFLGFTFTKVPILEEFLATVNIKLFKEETGEQLLMSHETWISIIGGLLGIAITALIYLKFSNRLGNSLPLLKKAFYFDEIYSFLLVRPLKALSRFIDNFLEPKLFEGSLISTEKTAQGSAKILQKIQSGQIRSYVAWMGLGMVLLITYLIM